MQHAGQGGRLKFEAFCLAKHLCRPAFVVAGSMLVERQNRKPRFCKLTTCFVCHVYTNTQIEKAGSEKGKLYKEKSELQRQVRCAFLRYVCMHAQGWPQPYMYDIYTTFLAVKASNIRSCTVYVYSPGQPFACAWLACSVITKVTSSEQ